MQKRGSVQLLSFLYVHIMRWGLRGWSGCMYPLRGFDMFLVGFSHVFGFSDAPLILMPASACVWLKATCVVLLLLLFDQFPSCRYCYRCCCRVCILSVLVFAHWHGPFRWCFQLSYTYISAQRDLLIGSTANTYTTCFVQGLKHISMPAVGIGCITDIYSNIRWLGALHGQVVFMSHGCPTFPL